MRGSTKFPEVERMLRKYRDSFYDIDDLRKEIKAKEEALKEVEALKATRLTGMPHGTNISDPTALYNSEIDRYKNEIDNLILQKRELEKFQAFINEKLSQVSKVIGSHAKAIIVWKYVERLPEKMILYKLKHEHKYQIGKAQLYNVIDTIYTILK